jgi:hypothetical protein
MKFNISLFFRYNYNFYVFIEQYFINMEAKGIYIFIQDLLI